MVRVLGGVSVLVLGLSVGANQDQGEEEAATPAEQYETLLEELERAGR